MKNLNLLKNLCVLTVTFMALFITGCSDGGSSKSSTKTCPSNAYYDQYDGEWYTNSYDRKICNPLPGASQYGCASGEVHVRSPYQYDNDYDSRYMTDSNYINSNYHINGGKYHEVCMYPGGAGWDHVKNAGAYYYVNLGAINTTLNASYGYSYSTPTYYYSSGQNNTANTVLTLGVLAALFLMTK
jgi:hypothetical protein